MLSMNDILQSHMRLLLARLRSQAPRATLAPADLMRDQGTSMEADDVPIRCDVLATLQKLPPVCLTRSQTTRAVIAIRRGELGYYLVDPPIAPEEFNRRHGITAAEVVAMENGSLLGWEVPEADPDVVRARTRTAKAEEEARDTPAPHRRTAVP